MLFNSTDKDLINKALDGSQRAWLKLVTRYEKIIYNYCLRMTSSDSDALDLMQEIFLSTYRNLPSFRGDAQFRTWIMRIAANRTIDFLRYKSSPTQKLFMNEDDITSAEDSEFSFALDAEKNNPETLCSEQTRNELIQNVMQRLPAEQRLLIELKFFSHFTFDEISYQTGISINTIKSRIYSSLDKMKTQMEDKKNVM